MLQEYKEEKMPNPKELAEQFLAALAANDVAHYAAVLSEDAALRLGRWDGSELYRRRQRVVHRFLDEWSAWADPILETFKGKRIPSTFLQSENSAVRLMVLSPFPKVPTTL